MKIIFLDIDGVCNYTRWYQNIDGRNPGNLYGQEGDLDPLCINRIIKICNETGAKVVISSDWRFDWFGTQIRLTKMGLDSNYVIDKTPEYIWKNVGREDYFNENYEETYEECSAINGAEGRISLSIIGKFTRLINARNAYWRIAGREMGLGEPWRPDWTDQKTPKYCIAGVEGQIKTAERYIVNTILAFPTEEMRDAFYENFKEEIEICKELL